MKISPSGSEREHDMQDAAETDEQFSALEQTLSDLRQVVGRRRTMLKDAEKKLQEFQDSIYALLIEDEFPEKRVFMPDHEDDDDM